MILVSVMPIPLVSLFSIDSTIREKDSIENLKLCNVNLNKIIFLEHII